MTPAQLTDPRSSPGANYVYATDPFGNKRWIQADDVVVTVSSTYKAFPSPTGTWSWNHALGYRPVVQAYNASWDLIIVDIIHDDVNNLHATHNANVAGFLLIP